MRYVRQICWAAAVALAGCGHQPSDAPPDGPADGHDQHQAGHSAGDDAEVHVSLEAQRLAGIKLGKVERRALTGGVAIPAEVQFEPSSTAHVSPLVSGRITHVGVSLGDSVKKGQLLGRVASTDASAARARLGQVSAQLSAAKSTERRQQALSSEGIGAGRALVEAKARVAELKAEVSGLRRQLSVLGAGHSGELVLSSPLDGVVVALHGTLGETATPEQPVFIVTDPTKVWVRGNVPELEIEHLKAGSAALVRMHAFPDLRMVGRVTYIAPALDEHTRSLPIRVSLTTPDPRLKSGLFGSVELVGGATDERALVIPAESVATLNGQTVVFAPADEADTFRARPVALGRRAGAFFEVREGLKEGALVAMTGAFTLKSALQSGELSEGHEH